MFQATLQPLPTAREARRTPVRTITLLDLVSELVEAGGSDREVVSAVLDLVETGRVRLVGQVREADLRWRNVHV